MIDIQLRGLDILQKRLKGIPGAAEWAIMRTLNDVAISGRQSAVEDILARYNIGDTPVRKGMKIEKATTDRPIAIIHVGGRRFPLAMFSPQREKEGVSFEEVRGKRTTIAHTFSAVMQYGPNVFRRKGEARGPVQMITGLSVANMAREEEKVLPDIRARIEEQLSKRAEFWMGEALAGNMAKYGGGHS
jgi:hypothetical protein